MESVRAQRWDGDEAEEADELGWQGLGAVGGRGILNGGGTKG